MHKVQGALDVTFLNQKDVDDKDVIGHLQKVKDLLVERFAKEAPSEHVATKMREFTTKISKQYRDHTTNVFSKAIWGKELKTIDQLEREILAFLTRTDDAKKIAVQLGYQGSNPISFYQALLKYNLLDKRPEDIFEVALRGATGRESSEEIKELISHVPQLNLKPSQQLAEKVFDSDSADPSMIPFYEKMIAQCYGKDYVRKDGVPLVMKVMQFNSLSLLQSLAKLGSSLDVKHPVTDSNLLHSRHIQDPRIIDFLIQNKVPVNAQNVNGRTPLHVQAYSAPKEVLAVLLKAKPDVNAEDKELETPLHLARSPDHFEMLVRAGADPSKKNQEGKVPELRRAVY